MYYTDNYDALLSALLHFFAAGDPIKVFIKLPLSEISKIDDRHSVSLAKNCARTPIHQVVLKQLV